MIICPGRAQLVRLLEEQLDDDELASITLHVEGCARCQDSLEDLTRDRPVPVPDEDDPFATGLWPAAGGESDWTVDRDLAAEPSGPGEVRDVAGYEILARLGHGGMGVVYKARQTRLNRLVALKMIRAGSLARPEHLIRLRLEAEAVAQLRHANIVQIHDVGEVDGLPYLALELLEGGSLEARVAGTPQPEREAAAMLATLASATDAAHRAGIVHRDLKSANVLFTADGVPKITDFGLAKRLDDDAGQTETGQVMGSPSFMAPEQARGQARGVGPAADVYALGAILYEMLTGRPPFKGATSVETLLQVIHDDPVSPSHLRAKLGRDLETICLKCLEKDPARRYESAGELADDLGRFLAGEPIRARRTPARERAVKWARREPLAAALAGLAVMAAAALAASGVWYHGQLRREDRRIAALRLDAADALHRGREALAQGRWADGRVALSEFLLRARGEPRLADLRAEALKLRDRIDRGLADQEARRADRDRLARFSKLRDEALLRDTQFSGLGLPGDVGATRRAAAAALAVFDESSPAPATLGPRERAEVEEGRCELLLVLAEAVAQPLAGEDPGRQAAEALAVLDRAAKGRPPTQAYHLRRAACLARGGDEAGAERERREAARHRPSGSFDHFLSGQERYKRRQWSAAALHFEQALRLGPERFWAHALLAVCQLQAQRPVEAKAGLDACVRLHPEFAWLYLLRGFALGEAGHLTQRRALQATGARKDDLSAEAADQFEAAEADYRAAWEHAPSDDERYVLLVNRGGLRVRRDRLDEAVADLEEAIRIRPDRFMAYASLAQARRRQGHRDEAIALLGRAIARKPDLPALYRSRASLRLEAGEADPAARDAALADLDEALRHEPPDGPDAAGDQAQRARLLHRSGRFDEAVAACEAALKADPDHAEALRLRAEALLELGRFGEVIRACDGPLTGGRPSAELHLARGLARAGRGDLAGAIDDYTRALALKPGRPAPHAHRGWAYALSDAPALALHDFDEAIRLDPTDPDTYNGRGYALALLGRHREAAADVEEALRRGSPAPTSRTLYNAARTLAQAAAAASEQAARRDPGLLRLSDGYLDRAQALVVRAIERLPADRRAAFWRDVVRADPALAAVRRRPQFAQWAARSAPWNAEGPGPRPEPGRPDSSPRALAGEGPKRDVTDGPHPAPAPLVVGRDGRRTPPPPAGPPAPAADPAGARQAAR
jgi:tetratricopeptide (TPR) repeat protein/tRNA A-37 threonylcarbamoyl transferase component Bud32